MRKKTRKADPAAAGQIARKIVDHASLLVETIETANPSAWAAEDLETAVAITTANIEMELLKLYDMLP